MTSSVLNLVQTFCDKQGLPRLSAVVTATDKSARQFQAIMREVIADLGEYRWQQQRVRGSFTSVAAGLQGPLTTLFGAGYAGMVRDSMWNDTRHMRIFGPISDQMWNALQTLPNAGPEFQCWISRDNLYLTPTAVAGETISAVFITKFNVLAGGTGSTYQEFVTDDTDTLLFPDNVVLKLFGSKWRKQKGESGWEDDYNDAIGLIAKNLVRDGGESFQLDCIPNSGARPGIIIPPGNWGV